MSDYSAGAPRPNHPRSTVPIIAAAHFALGFLCGFLSSVFAHPNLRRQKRMTQWTRQWRHAVKHMILDHAAEHSAALPLSTALLGRTRSQILLTLGAPPASSSPSHMLAPHYWHADTWYYPLDFHRRLAVAITFADDRAASVETLHGPLQ